MERLDENYSLKIENQPMELTSFSIRSYDSMGYHLTWWMRLIDVLIIPWFLVCYVVVGNAKTITWTLKQRE